MIKRSILFLTLNFSALAVGRIFTKEGVPSEWYQNLAKAPWTPPGWAFGIAWSVIMICFAIYMSYLIPKNIIKVILLYTIQWALNVIWSPVFFYYKNIVMGLVVISSLTLLILYFTIHYINQLKIKTFYIAPYLIWLTLATSLNLYILIFN